MTDAWDEELADIIRRNPNCTEEPHELLKQFPRGFNSRTGNAYTQKRLTKDRFHYAFCSTSNPNYYGCRKCDFYWSQYGELEMEARKAAFQDEAEVLKGKDTKSSVPNQPKPQRRLPVVLEKLEQMAKDKLIAHQKESVKHAKEALEKAMANCFVGYDDENSSLESLEI